MLANLVNVSAVLVERVAANLGKPVPDGDPADEVTISAAPSLIPSEPAPIAGRIVAVYAADGVDSTGLATVRKPLEAAGAVVMVIAPHGGSITSDNEPVPVAKAALTTQPVEYDAVIVASGDSADTLAHDPYIAMNLTEAYRHHKTIAAWGAGQQLLDACGIAPTSQGVITADTLKRAFTTALVDAIGWHRHWDRPAQTPST